MPYLCFLLSDGCIRGVASESQPYITFCRIRKQMPAANTTNAMINNTSSRWSKIRLITFVSVSDLSIFGDRGMCFSAERNLRKDNHLIDRAVNETKVGPETKASFEGPLT